MYAYITQQLTCFLQLHARLITLQLIEMPTFIKFSLLQDIPLHVAMISHILIAWDRMRWLGDPLKGRLPAFVCCCATWLAGMVIALPYPIYTIYLEIGVSKVSWQFKVPKAVKSCTYFIHIKCLF